MNSEGAKQRRFISGLVIGIALGVAFVAAPIEIILLAIPASACMALFLCVRNPARLPAAGLASVAFVSVIFTVAVTKTDALDKRPASFSTNTVTVADLVQHGIAHQPTEAEWTKTQIRLPSKEPTIREIMQAVNDQAPFRAKVWRCGTGASILRGAWVSKISFSAKEPQAARDVVRK